MNLAELEQYFARAATSGSGPLADLDRVFLGSERLSATERLAIYNRGYFYRLLDALASVFGQTKRVLGDSEFTRLGLEYVAQHPSDQPAVERVGRSFSDYLRRVGAPSLVVDLAALEWARLSALVAANPASVATVNAIEPSSFPHSRLRFVPSLHWLELEPQTLAVFAGQQPWAVGGSAADAQRPRCGVAVWRSQHTVVHESLGVLEWQALLCAVGGATLSQVCSVFASEAEDDAVQRAFQVLSRWFARKWLKDVVIFGA